MNKIEIKFNIGDSAFVIENNKIECLTVCRVTYDKIEGHCGASIQYHLRRHNHTDAVGIFFESDMFKTKEDLIKSL